MIDEMILDHGKSYINKCEFENAEKVFRNETDFQKGSENDEIRRSLLAYCLFQMAEFEQTMAIAKTIQSTDLLRKELASALICNSLHILKRYEEAFSVMKTYLANNKPKLYLRTLKVFLEDIAKGAITDEVMINEIKAWAIKHKVNLDK